MDIRQYFRKVREIEASIAEDFPLVMSLETSDGGKAGVTSEVSRHNAARLITEGRAALATEAQKEDYQSRQKAEKQAFEAAELARKVQVAILDRSALAHLNNTPSYGNGK